jgi:hypothetical protein
MDENVPQIWRPWIPLRRSIMGDYDWQIRHTLVPFGRCGHGLDYSTYVWGEILDYNSPLKPQVSLWQYKFHIYVWRRLAAA